MFSEGCCPHYEHALFQLALGETRDAEARLAHHESRLLDPMTWPHSAMAMMYNYSQSRRYELEVLGSVRQARIDALVLLGRLPEASQLAEDLFSLIERCVERGIAFGARSNGTRVTKQIASRLASLGAAVVGVSFDGATSSVHDATRGSGAFAAAVRGVEALVAADGSRPATSPPSVCSTCSTRRRPTSEPSSRAHVLAISTCVAARSGSKTDHRRASSSSRHRVRHVA